MSDMLDALEQYYSEIDRETRPLAVLHADRLQCRKGCASCCIDDLTVFEIEAANIRHHHVGLLERGVAGPSGGCVFLDGEGSCRIYDHRPYVCRTQGLPLRWTEESEGELVEFRDICPLNDADDPIERLPSGSCWELGPYESKLAELQRRFFEGAMKRIGLRDLFQ